MGCLYVMYLLVNCFRGQSPWGARGEKAGGSHSGDKLFICTSADPIESQGPRGGWASWSSCLSSLIRNAPRGSESKNLCHRVCGVTPVTLHVMQLHTVCLNWARGPVCGCRSPWLCSGACPMPAGWVGESVLHEWKSNQLTKGLLLKKCIL